MKYAGVTQDTLGNAISGVAVTVKNAGTAVLTTLYTDNAYGSTTANPVTSAADGSYSFFVKDARLDLTFVKTGYSFNAQNSIDAFQPLGDSVKTPADFTTLAINTASTGAIDMIGATVTTFLINKPITCTATDTIPSTCTLVFLGTGDLTISGGATLTINGPVWNLTDHAVVIGPGTAVYGNGAGSKPYFDKRVAETYSTSITPDLRTGNHRTITITDGVAFAINAPTGPYFDGMEVTFTIINSSGGAHGAITWNTVWKLAGALAAIANGSNKTVTFRFSGTTNFYEASRSPADVAN
jgi:hypothetical protein